MTDDLVLWTAADAARIERLADRVDLLAAGLGGLLLAVLGLAIALAIWLVAEHTRRRRAELELRTRLTILEAARNRRLEAHDAGSPRARNRTDVGQSPAVGG